MCKKATISILIKDTLMLVIKYINKYNKITSKWCMEPYHKNTYKR